MLRDTYREHPWEIGKFSKAPQSYWSSSHSQKKFILELGEKLGIKTGDYASWYKITVDDILRHGGRGLLFHHGNSVIQILKSVFPEHHWNPGKFIKIPKNIWASKSFQRDYLDELGETLGIKKGELEGWYVISYDEVIKHGGSSLLNRYNSSLSEALMAVYPEHPWDVSRFSKKPQNYWASMENQRRYFEELGEKMCFAKGDYAQWYSVTTQTIIKHGGGALLSRYSYSVANALKAVFPEHEWDINRFSTKPRNYWTSIKNQKEFMEHIRINLGVKVDDFDAWYQVTPMDVIKLGGGSFMMKHSNSIANALKTVYPDHPWDDSLFTTRPRNYWAKPENQKAFMETLRLKLDIKDGDYDAWYKVTTKDVIRHGGRGLIEVFSNIPNLVSAVFPDHKWYLPSLLLISSTHSHLIYQFLCLFNEV